MKGNLLAISIIFLMFYFSCSAEKSEILSPEELSILYNDFVQEITSDSSLAKITLQRTQCFGACPIYSVGIFEDGTVRYFGKTYVDETGLHSSNISSDALNTLVSYAMENDFSNLDEGYYTKTDTAEDGTIYEISVSDLPTQITSLRIKGKRKIVNNYFGGPSWLNTFESKIDSTVNIKQWVGN